MSPEAHILAVIHKTRLIASEAEQKKIDGLLLKYQAAGQVEATAIIGDLQEIVGYNRLRKIVLSIPPN